MDIKNFIREKKWKNWKKDQWLILFLAGVLLLVIALPASSGKNEKEETKVLTQEETEKVVQEDIISYETQLEERLEAILQNVDGVGQVQVMITLKNEGEYVVEKDVESTYQTSGSGTDDGQNTTVKQTSETTVYENQTDEGGLFISKEIKPEIEGVLVAAQGGGNAVTAQNISDAIKALFDVEVHKIKIVKMNLQEGTN